MRVLLKISRGRKRIYRVRIGMDMEDHSDLPPKKYQEMLFWEGFAYCYGRGKPQSYEEAVKYFTKAALIGHAEAATQMGFMALNGYGVEKSVKDAYDWFMMAAAKEEPVALYKLGEMYENGTYVEKNLDTAIKYYFHSSDRNNPDAKVALKRLGKM